MLLTPWLDSFVLVCVGVRDQPLDWQTAPPVHVLSYLVLGGKKDAMSKEVREGGGRRERKRGGRA
jgi:hypothetical protein